jgi:hypothetical protein
LLGKVPFLDKKIMNFWMLIVDKKLLIPQVPGFGLYCSIEGRSLYSSCLGCGGQNTSVFWSDMKFEIFEVFF